MFLSANIAPTEEVVLIAHLMTPWHTIALATLSLLVLHAFVYALEFKGQHQRAAEVTVWREFTRFTVIGYLIALTISSYICWSFGRFDGLPFEGVLLLASGVSFLVYQALTHQDEPGAVSVTVSDIRNTGTAYLVRFAVHNNGGETLSHLHLTAHLRDGDVQVESAQVFIDYLPGRSKHEGGVYLKHDPGRYTLEIVPAGYMKP